MTTTGRDDGVVGSIFPTEDSADVVEDGVDVIMRNLDDAMRVFGGHADVLTAYVGDEAEYFSNLTDQALIELMCANQMLVTTINHVGGLTALAMKVRGFTLAPLEPQ